MDVNPKPTIPVIRFVLARHDEIKNWRFGKKFTSFVRDEYPLLFPEYAHFYEPINVPVDMNNVDYLKPYWKADGTMWARRTNIRSSGHWFNEVRGFFPDGMLKFYWSIEYNKKLNFSQLMLDSKKVFGADFACIAVDTKMEDELSDVDRNIHRDMRNLPAIRTYKEKMHALGWAQYMSNLFMERYFGEDWERVASLTSGNLGIEVVRRTKAGLYWQLTPSPYDVEEDIVAYTELRKKAQTVIGDQHFTDPQQAWEELNTPIDMTKSMVGIVLDPDQSHDEQQAYKSSVIDALKKAFMNKKNG